MKTKNERNELYKKAVKAAKSLGFFQLCELEDKLNIDPCRLVKKMIWNNVVFKEAPGLYTYTGDDK